MAYVPQQPLWVPYDPTYYNFPGHQPTTHRQIHRVDTCDCATCKSCRAKGHSNIYQWVDEHYRQNPPELSHPCNNCPPGTPLRTTTTFTPVNPASIRRSQELEERLQELRRIRQQWYTQVVLATTPDELAKTSEERLQDRNNHRRQMQTFDEILRDDAAITEGEILLRDLRRSRRRRMQSMFDNVRTAVDEAYDGTHADGGKILLRDLRRRRMRSMLDEAYEDAHVDGGNGEPSMRARAGNQAPVFEPASIADMGPGSCDVEQCQWCASASSSSGSSGDSAAGPADPWGPEGWGSDKGSEKGKGKEKEVQPQQEPEEELIMPTLFNEKKPENKETESGTSKRESESSSPSSEALSGSASREF
ncbi:hypothetical protein PG984_014321 [Apiospora sp. TS-2023a]